jgi:FeS assembly protein IscX
VKRELTWDDPEAVGLALFEKFPQKNPLAVRFTDLRRWILELEGFTGDPAASTEGTLEAIQMAWNEEWQDAQG